MSAHYRSPMNYSNIHLESASDRVYYIYEVLLYLATNCLAFVDAVGKHNLFMHLFIILYMSCTIDVY
jgi:cysteinyl-tRNA synthetase